MDLNKTYNNRNLEFRRKKLLKIQQADAVLRERKDRRANTREQIVAAFDRGEAVGPLGQQILNLLGSRKRRMPVTDREALRRLLVRVEAETDLLNDFWRVLDIVRMARQHAHWIRPPEQWVARSHNVKRQLSSLTRHLFAKYDVPIFMDSAWSSVGQHGLLEQKWFIHVGTGGNIRKAGELPISLTKMMAHHFLLADNACTIPQALRWGQLCGMGVARRTAQAVLGSRIGDAFGEAEAEAFWASVFNFFVLNPMIDPHQVGPIIDYLHHQKFTPAGMVNVDGTFVQQGPPQPGLSMKGRSPDTLVAQVHAWHRQLRRVRHGTRDVAWKSSGIAGYDRVEGVPGHQRRFVVTELLSSSELRAEGSAMHHCVATYVWSCQQGRTAIYSMKYDPGFGRPLERCVTIEVDVLKRQITQVRSKFNAPSTPVDQRVLNGWATTARLTFSKFALTRWA
jgi:hypothetical protein